MRQRGTVWGENTHTLYTMIPSQECEGVSHTGTGNSKYRRLLWLDMNRKTTGTRKAKIKLFVMSPRVIFAQSSVPSRISRRRGVGPAKKCFPRVVGGLRYIDVISMDIRNLG